MKYLTISIFKNKIFSEIINELKLFSKFKLKYYDNLDLCLKQAQKGTDLVIFFDIDLDVNSKNKIKLSNFPFILVLNSSPPKNNPSVENRNYLYSPFSILDFEKKIISVNSGGFNAYMKSIGKFGGQNKCPHLLNDRRIADFLLKNYKYF